MQFKNNIYAYDGLNRLISAGATSLAYDPLLRLTEIVSGAATTRFGYDGINMIAEHDGANTLQRRFVHGPGSDEPLVDYWGAGTTNRTCLHADERGSIIARSDASGTVTAINRNDEYGIPGIPGAPNQGRFQYTGQAWPEIGMQYSKNRIYSPTLGRFLQTDPIGIEVRSAKSATTPELGRRQAALATSASKKWIAPLECPQWAQSGQSGHIPFDFILEPSMVVGVSRDRRATLPGHID